ncbi:MAG: hypothetical protein IIC81_06685 [Chloroflexi bacterium]|nr:hypothetical protein [Chloroflexota bacterium]
MGYRVEFREETEEELNVFSHKHRRALINKIRHVADNLPQSLRLKTVQPIRGAPADMAGRLFELDVGSGPRVAFVLYEEQKLLVVYLIGTHDYAKANYLRAAERRLTL